MLRPQVGWPQNTRPQRLGKSRLSLTRLGLGALTDALGKQPTHCSGTSDLRKDHWQSNLKRHPGMTVRLTVP